MRAINNNYDRSVKESSLSPPGGIHTQESAQASTCYLQQGKKTLSTQLYSARLTRQEKRKDSKDMQGYLACGLHLQEALLACVLIFDFINSRIGSLTNHSL